MLRSTHTCDTKPNSSCSHCTSGTLD